MSIEQQVKHIVAVALGESVHDIEHGTRLQNWQDVAQINDETCMALNINISTMDASLCRTFGEYWNLVQQRAA